MNQNSQMIKDLVAQMVEEDQKMRSGEIEWDSQIDKRHTEALKPLLSEMPHRWPTITEHGEELCRQIWLLVQHSDHDVKFQQECLENAVKLMEENPKEVVKRSIAYLTDRIMVQTNQVQKYGTQFYEVAEPAKKTFMLLRPLIDPENIDNLRNQMMLEPLEDYRKIMEKSYKMPAFLSMEKAEAAGFKPPEVPIP